LIGTVAVFVGCCKITQGMGLVSKGISPRIYVVIGIGESKRKYDPIDNTPLSR